MLGFALLQLVWLLAKPIGLLLAAMVLASALMPLVDLLTRWMPRMPAILLVYLALLATVGGIGWLVIPPLVGQARALVEAAPTLIEQGRAWFDRWDAVPFDDDQIVGHAGSSIAGAGGFLVSLPLRILSALLEIMLVVAMSAYLVAAGPGLARFIRSLVPPRHRDHAADVLGEMWRTMGGYVRGVVLDGLIVAAITYAGLLIIGVPYPLVLALVAFLGELIPVAGPMIAGAPAVGLALTDSPLLALVVLAFYFAVQQFESYVILPHIMKKQADIPPLLTLFALLAGGALAGVFGAILAIPLSGALRVFVLRVAAPALRRWTGSADAAEAAAPGSEGSTMSTRTAR